MNAERGSGEKGSELRGEIIPQQTTFPAPRAYALTPELQLGGFGAIAKVLIWGWLSGAIDRGAGWGGGDRVIIKPVEQS